MSLNKVSKIKKKLTLFFLQVFCWTDKWYGMTMEDIRELEDKTKAELDEERSKGEIRGTKGVEN